ncbi:hypothetical protein Tco_1438518 [Tanacetum coccineum]
MHGNEEAQSITRTKFLMKNRGKGLPMFIKKQVLSNLKNGIRCKLKLKLMKTTHRVAGSIRKRRIRPPEVLFEATMKRVNTFTLMESYDTVPKVVAGSSKRSAKEEIDMLKNFDRDDLVKLWDLVRERFSSTEPTDEKERALWFELKRLLKPDTDDLLELQRYMHDPLTWRLYDICGVHHVSTETGLDIFMLVEKDLSQ